VIADLPFSVSDVDLPIREVDVEATNRSIRVAGAFRTTDLHLTRYFTPLSRRRYREIPLGGNRHSLPPHLQSPCWLAHKTGAQDVMGRLHWDRPAVTIRTEFWKPEKGRYLHPEADRPITHLEAALLQGFPRSFKWCGTKTEIGRQIGNAVPVPLARAIGQAILRSAAAARL
jgi:DNA (cytosine-5)-methyltransferase 1